MEDAAKELDNAQQKHDEHHGTSGGAAAPSSEHASTGEHKKRESHGHKGEHKAEHTPHKTGKKLVHAHKDKGHNKAKRGSAPSFLAPTFTQQAHHAKLKNAGDMHDEEIELGDSTLSELLVKYKDRERKASIAVAAHKPSPSHTPQQSPRSSPAAPKSRSASRANTVKLDTDAAGAAPSTDDGPPALHPIASERLSGGS